MKSIRLSNLIKLPALALAIAGMAEAQSYPNGNLEEKDHVSESGGFRNNLVSKESFNYSSYDQMIFTNNAATLGGGGVFYVTTGETSLSFTNNNRIVFSNNEARKGTYDEGYGGALSMHGAALNFKGNQEVSFLNNYAFTAGGAIYLTDRQDFLFDSNGKVVFEGNKSGSNGGAIYGGYASETTFSNNNEVVFRNNNAGYHGGAIFQGGYTFENNASVLFDGNSATIGGGGAIYAGRKLIFTGNDSIVFSNNSSGILGSAVLASNNIVIEKGGDVLFTNNNATGLGAALYVAASAGNLLSADRGNIVFTENYSNTSGAKNRFGAWFASNSQWASQGVIPSLNIRAAEGRSVEFHDALWVTNSNDLNFASIDVDFNKGEGYEGTVLFSGRQNGGHVLESIISGNVNVHNGIFSIRDKAQVSLYEMMDNSGGTIVSTDKDKRFDFAVLDVKLFEIVKGGKLYAGNISGGPDTLLRFGTGAQIDATSLDFKNGATFDLNPFYDSMDSGATVVSGNWALGGAITLSDKLSVYEDRRWSGKKEYMLFFDENSSRGDQDFDSIKTLATGTNIVDSPYTFKGIWTYEWEGDTLNAVWTPTGGITDVEPELEGNLVSNSMLSTASNMHTMAMAALGNIDLFRIKSDVKRNVWAKGVGDFAQNKSMGEIDGYKYQGGGYVVGADYIVGKNAIFGAAFGEMFGCNKSDRYDAHVSQRTLMMSAYGAKLQEFESNKDQSILWTYLASMGNGSNNMKTKYSDGEASRGKWDSDAFYLEGKATWRIASEGKRWVYTPFMGVEFTQVNFVDFTEEGDKARRFTDGDYANLALPIGIGAEHHSSLYSKPWLNVFQVSYVPDVYRSNPVANAQRLKTGYEWRDNGINASKHAIRASINSTLQLNKNWTTYAGYTFEGRGSSIYHRVVAGGSYSF